MDIRERSQGFQSAERTDGLGLAVGRFPYGASKRGRGVYPVRRGHGRLGQPVR